jgi:alpha-beta hydrolase superfamily lysophospholipase
MLDYGVSEADVLGMRRLTEQGEPWDAAAERLADGHRAAAAEAVRTRRAEAAADEYREEVAILMFAQMPLADGTRKRALYDRIAEALAAVNSLQPLWFERFDVPFECGALVGWLVLPEQLPARGAVVVFGGQSGWGAAYSRYADQFREAGIATLLVEGPGQGLTRLQHGVMLDVDIARAYSRFVDVALTDDRIEGHVGLLGNSMGGLFAAKTAAADRRVAACCVNGAPARASLFEFRSFVEQAAAMLGTNDTSVIQANFDRISFDSTDETIECPVMVLHGGRDILFPDVEVQMPFFDAATVDKTVRVWADGDHTIYNHAVERTHLVAEWFAPYVSRITG